ncbi:DUF2756 domain-containing protein [Salmonella enterica]|uniref:DUF2756 domain-containing protein n=1 Tax=Salmonella enterica TaxID=28901 RepID=UPI00398C80CC
MPFGAVARDTYTMKNGKQAGFQVSQQAGVPRQRPTQQVRQQGMLRQRMQKEARRQQQRAIQCIAV